MNGYRGKDKKGFTLLELTLALGISSVALAGVWQMSMQASSSIQGRLLGAQALAFAVAARDAVNDSRETILAALPNIDDTSEIVASDIQDGGYLPQDFNNENSYGQSFRLFVKREDAGAPGPSSSDRIVALVLSDGGETISDRIAGTLVASMGAAGGFIYSENASYIRGAAGGWNIDLTGAGWSSLSTYTPSAGHIAVLTNLLPDRGGSGGGQEFLLPENAECNEANKGKVRWSETNQLLEMCDGSTWRMMATIPPAACSGPSAFSFTDKTDQPLSALVESNAVTPTGCDATLTAFVTGSGNPEISINNGAWTTSGSIYGGQSIKVRLTSSNNVGEVRQATVYVGTTSTTWDVTARSSSLKIFATPHFYNGDLGGLSGADTICQAEANLLGYSGNYKAILSDSTTNVKDRLSLSYPIISAANGNTISIINLWAGYILAVVPTSPAPWYGITWTGSYSNGTKKSSTCNDWTSSSSSFEGGIGTAGRVTSSQWLDGLASWSFNTRACNNTAALYCIQQ